MNMSETKQISNVKPNEWYTKYYSSMIKGGLDDYLIESMEADRKLDVDHVIADYLSPFNEQMHESQLIMNPLYRKYDNLPFQERNDKLMNINAFVAAKNQFHKAHENYYHNVPPGVTEKEFNRYHKIIRGKIYVNLEILFNYNTLEKNDKFLEFLIAQQNALKKKRIYKQFCSLTRCNNVYKIREKRFKLCEQTIKKGYLITNQLSDLDFDIKDCRFCLLQEKEKKRPKNILDLYFEDFSYTDEQVFNLIRKNERWHNIERDLTIYQEKKKGKIFTRNCREFRY